MNFNSVPRPVLLNFDPVLFNFDPVILNFDPVPILLDFWISNHPVQ